jgi:prevent-host-death family protein
MAFYEQFNQGASEAKRAANNGPVFITDRGRPAHVLMSIELYQRLTGNHKKIADLLAMPDITDLDRMRGKPRPSGRGQERGRQRRPFGG